jgi:hypothetical protein
MADLTGANVRVVASRNIYEADGVKRQKLVEVHGGSWGGTTNRMLATAFGLQLIEEASAVRYGSYAYLALPASDGGSVLAYDTIGGASAPVDISVPATPNGMYFQLKGL